MSKTDNAVSTPRLSAIFLGVALFWSILIAALAGWNCRQAYLATVTIVRSSAFESYSKDLVYRRWATMHGGVYAPITTETQPNPYLSHIPERDISTPSGKKLTLINPAYMTRQVHELGGKDYGARGHITSLKPIRPENIPDEWEKSALQAFQLGEKEISSLVEWESETYLRFMRPLITEVGCLKCHATQGYRVNDIRGGISVSLPWTPFREALRSQLIVILLAYGGIWMIGILGLHLGRKRLQNHLSRRRQAEEQLVQSHALLANLARLVPGVIYQYRLYPDGRSAFPYASPGMNDIYEMTPEEVQEDATPVFGRLHPEDYDHVSHAIQESARTLQTFYCEFRVILPRQGLRWRWSQAHPERLGDGGTLWHGIISDITERKLAEEEKRSLEERLQRSEKMEALGQLAGGVAHDLNNVLGILTGYSELLLEEIPEGHRSRGHAERILQSTEKGAAIIEDLLTLARRGVTSAEVIDLNTIVANFLKTPVFEKMKDYHPRVTFRAECDQNLLNIKGSPVHLEKTLMNLVSNAAEAISGKGEVTIRTESRYLDKPVQGYDEMKEGDYAVLTVSDTGMGIPPENREKIFEPFYTKKAMGRSGTGLGLAIVWGTVKDHNGYIDLHTEAGQGTTFTLYFPVTREEMIVHRQKVPIERYLGNGESVLVVDDVAEQRDVAARLLTRLGYEVHAVSSGEEAAAWLREHTADILVLDMIMAPGIDGLETYERILEINPQQKAILVSGFSETERVKRAQALGAGSYVKKPYVMERIGVAIRDELKR